MGRILAIDYGRKRVGLAVSDPMRIVGTALRTVEEKEALGFITGYVKAEQVDLILIGYPLNSRGESTHATPYVEKFIVALQKQLPEIPVEKRDESFSSKEAMQVLIRSGVKKKQRRDKSLLDQTAAALILQEYLQNL
ncbi:MAG: Holliday junction resolvase RuvX [Chitinophagales bacterium]